MFSRIGKERHDEQRRRHRWKFQHEREQDLSPRGNCCVTCDLGSSGDEADRANQGQIQGLFGHRVKRFGLYQKRENGESIEGTEIGKGCHLE